VSDQILFFDDFPLSTENQIFTMQLRIALRGTKVDVVVRATIRALERSLRAQMFIAIVLDIMAAMPDAPAPGMETRAGLEVLKRCRTGQYGEINRNAPVYIRSARGELHVKQEAAELGCRGYFHAGSDDEKLIAVIKDHVVKG
jgi:CheY-like chemotaxis protein